MNELLQPQPGGRMFFLAGERRGDRRFYVPHQLFENVVDMGCVHAVHTAAGGNATV